jgi:hypothetical protein
LREQAIRRQAVFAAARMAEEISRNIGWLEYYRIGAYDGLRLAVNDPTLGAWDFREGVRLGLRDPEALRIGGEEGRRAAEESAAGAASDQVSAQFRGLAREPLYSPRADPPSYAPAAVWVTDPSLEEVFRDHPPTAGPFPRLARAFGGWRYDPWGMYRCYSHDDLHDPHWADPERALALWRSQPVLAAAYRNMSQADRRAFDEAFREEFTRSIAVLFDEYERRGYRAGFEDGWGYGALVRGEWQFRGGYNDGFNQAAASSAAAGFRASYRVAFERSYRHAFDEWMFNPKPEILSVRLSDRNDDGIFEPGEEILTFYRIANYGGTDGTFPVSLQGQAIEQAAETVIDLPARSVVGEGEPLRSRIRTQTPIRTRASLDFRLAGLARSVEFLVSRPLEFSDSASVVRTHALEGEATLGVRIANRSRRAVVGSVELAPAEGFRVARDIEPVEIDAGGSRSMEIELDGVRPLDLLSGGLAVRLTLASGGTANDELVFRLPCLATDLGNRDLLVYMAALAGDRAASTRDIAGVRDLLMRRLRADWDVAVDADGNPYKEDAADRGTRTALGDLVRTYRQIKGSIRNPAVFEDLGAEIQQLADDLPGIHPLLRKHMKKLAGGIE